MAHMNVEIVHRKIRVEKGPTTGPAQSKNSGGGETRICRPKYEADYKKLVGFADWIQPLLVDQARLQGGGVGGDTPLSL